MSPQHRSVQPISALLLEMTGLLLTRGQRVICFLSSGQGCHRRENFVVFWRLMDLSGSGRKALGHGGHLTEVGAGRAVGERGFRIASMVLRGAALLS